MARRRKLNFKTETVPITDLRPHPRNYVEHPADQIAHIIQSIRQHGFYRNIIIAKDGTILAGHGVVTAARQDGFVEVPVVRLPIKFDSPAALKVLTGDNELRHLAAVDDRALADLLKEIKDDDAVGLAGTGYDEMMLAGLLVTTRAESEIEGFDAAAEWVGEGMPEYSTEGEERTRLTICFDDEKDREKIIEQLGLIITKVFGKTSVAWWPPRPREDRKSLRFEQKGTAGVLFL